MQFIYNYFFKIYICTYLFKQINNKEKDFFKKKKKKKIDFSWYLIFVE